MSSQSVDFMKLLFEPDSDGTPARPIRRAFYRCGLCLGSFAVDDDHPSMRDAECDCGGKLTYMGWVKRDRLVQGAIGVPCDGRCTSATGPVCDCQCGGENHGSMRVVFFDRDMGGVPRMVSGSVDADKRFARRDEFGALREQAETLFEQLPGDMGSYWDPSPKRFLRAAILKARKSKAHHHRMKLLREAIDAAKP